MNEDKKRILLVEDEENLAVGLEFNLSREGYAVTRAADGRMALDIVFSRQFDLIILDVMLPFLDGFEVAIKIRETYPQMPILMLTARTAAKDRIRGLEVGADDYLTKPFHLKELLLRVQGMIKRKQWYQDLPVEKSIFRFGVNEINFENLKCKTGKRERQLTPREAMVLKYLILHKGRIVSRTELLENVWHLSPDVETRTVDNFIARLRKYFEIHPENPVHIKSVRGAGYVFEG